MHVFFEELQKLQKKELKITYFMCWMGFDKGDSNW